MLEFKKLKRVHMIGIKGTGMSGLALILHALGIKVTGSDASDSFLLINQNRFAKAGIIIADDFSKNNIPKDANAVIASSSHLIKNVEIREARRLKIPILTYADAVGLLSRKFSSIAICGSHGKTTTTNLLAHILQQAKIPVLPLAGPTSEQVLDNLRREGFFIFEADEYQNKLKHYSPFGAILTNIELDHPDYFKTTKQYERIFSQFVRRVPPEGFLVYCADDEAATRIASKASCKKLGYGFSESADYSIRAVTDSDTATPFAIHNDDALLGVFRTPLLGTHNILNSAATALAAKELGVKQENIQNGLLSFRGSPRRMEKVSDHPLIIDDYGHHPTEIKTTLRAVKTQYPDKKIIAVFHPHTYTRTKKFLKEFGAAFSDADYVIVLDIFESREAGKQTITSKNVVDEIAKFKKDAYYCPTFADAAKLLKGKLNDGTLLLTIGAGDVWRLHKML